MLWLQRNRALSFLNMKDYESAEEAIKSAQFHDFQSPQAHFLAFKLALLKENQEKGRVTTWLVIL